MKIQLGFSELNAYANVEGTGFVSTVTLTYGNSHVAFTFAPHDWNEYGVHACDTDRVLLWLEEIVGMKDEDEQDNLLVAIQEYGLDWMQDAIAKVNKFINSDINETNYAINIPCLINERTKQ